MPSKRPRRQSNSSPWIRNASVPRRKPASTMAFMACRSLNCAQAVHAMLGFSLSDAGIELSRLLGRPKPMTKQAVYKMLRSNNIGADILQAYGQMVSNFLSKSIGVDVGITVNANSPWHITPWLRCEACRDFYAVDKPGVVHCPKCR